MKTFYYIPKIFFPKVFFHFVVGVKTSISQRLRHVQGSRQTKGEVDFPENRTLPTPFDGVNDRTRPLVLGTSPVGFTTNRVAGTLPRYYRDGNERRVEETQG